MSITVAIIGCGGIARFHADGMRDCGARIAYVCDLDAAAAERFAATYGARAITDYRDALADADVDAIVVATISRVHVEICLAAIAAGKAVICEKTLAENADDSLRIVQAARAAGVIFYTSYMKRFLPAVEKAKALLPRLGRIVSTHIRAYQCWGDVWSPAPPDFRAPSVAVQKYGGGVLVCGGSHILDLVGHFLGRPHRLYASMHTPPGRDHDVQAAALLETANGVVHFEALCHKLYQSGVARNGWDEQVEIHGTDGILQVYTSLWNDVTHAQSLLRHHDLATGTTTEHAFRPCSPFAKADAFFAANIAAGTQGSQGMHTGYDVDELIATIMRSAAEHRALDVNYRFD